MTFSRRGREYLENQVEVLQKENERIRQTMADLHSRVSSMPENTTHDNVAHSAIQHAELVIAKQTVEDYRIRLDKMGQFFVQTSEQFRKAVHEILGWRFDTTNSCFHV